MKDRVPLYPGRVKLSLVSGATDIYDMTRADQPQVEGTALNKKNLLSDETGRALFGDNYTGEETVNDALKRASGAAFMDNTGYLSTALGERLNIPAKQISGMAYEPILEITTTAAASQVDIDVSGIDWDKYMWVKVYTVLKSTTTSSSTSYNFKLLLDNRTYDYQYHTTSSSDSGGDCLCNLYAQPTRPCFHEMTLGYADSLACFRDDGLMDGKNYDYNPRIGRIATTSAPATLNLVSGNTDYQIAAGTKIKIVGVKA